MFITTAIVLAGDLYTKKLAMDNLGPDLSRGYPFGRAVQVIPGFFDLRWAENTGGAFSLFHQQPWIILSVSIIMIIGIIVWAITLHQRAFIVQLALGMVIGGAIGNLIDRIRYGYVIDFLHVYTIRNGREYFWPTFNIADVGIVVGIAIFMVLALFTKLLDPPEEDQATAPEPASATTAD